MKKITGIIVLILSIAFLGILVLRIWGVEIVSPANVLKSSVTLIVLGIAIVVLAIIYGAFFRNQAKGYHKEAGKHAHPKS